MHPASNHLLLLRSTGSSLLLTLILAGLNLLGGSLPAMKIRVWCLALLGFKISRKASLAPGVVIQDFGDQIVIGDYTFINRNVLFDARGAAIRIGRYCEIGYNVLLLTSRHALVSDFQRNRPLIESLPITIEDHVWIGAGAILRPGVTIGRGAVVGAGAVVTRNVPPNTVVAGNPAKPIRQLNTEATVPP
ncbi:MAG TPA: DapH/DapD/GlmU-related protein [Oculatellaceae cyanobacterium]|jgi:acetyltransferase-like isoleucine patch superfamily enzyme